MNRRIQVNETRFSWMGEVLWEEAGFGKDVWYVVRPDHPYQVLARRGGSNREYAEQLIRIPSWYNHAFLVTRKNLMTGKEYQEEENTPLSCSPASETYWSM